MLEFNGVAEWFNQTVLNMVQCFLHDLNLSHSFWGEALHTMTIIYNHLPHCTNGGKSPLHVWNSATPDILHIHVFGCQTHLLVPAHL
jgi:hypothetical protein